MQQNKLLAQVFEKMDEMGWTLEDNEYDDFKYVYDYHKETMEKLAEDEEREEDTITWLSQFMLDFLKCLEELGDK